MYVKYSLFHRLLGHMWLLGTFVNSSCNIKINIKIVQNCCRNLTVKGLSYQNLSASVLISIGCFCFPLTHFQLELQSNLLWRNEAGDKFVTNFLPHFHRL